MRNRKRRVELISFYDHTGLENHFSRMAEKGWLIEGISNLFWTYRRIEPKALRFAVTYYPKASDFDPEPSVGQRTFLDFCAHTGWQLACGWHQMQIFYNEQEDPVPLETDPGLAVDTIHKACRRNFLPSYFLMIVLGIIMGGWFVAGLSVTPITFLSNASYLLCGTALLLMGILAAVELSAYYLWYYRAKKDGANGIFRDTPSTSKFQSAVMIVLLLALGLWCVNLVCSGDLLYTRIALMMFLGLIAAILAVEGIKQGLKKVKTPADANQFMTICACFLLSFALTGCVTWIAVAGTPEEDPGWSTDLPLSLTDLTAVNEEDYIADDRIRGTALVGQRIVYQRPDFEVADRAGMPVLSYTVTDVRVPLFYGWCKQQMFRTSAWGDNGKYIISYRETDPQPWGALEAWCQLDEQGTEKNSFLLCYEDRFVLIHFDFEPTAEQMKIVQQKLS